MEYHLKIPQKFFGIYQGDLIGCVPVQLLELAGIDISIISPFTQISLVVGPGQNIKDVSINVPSGLVNLDVNFDVTQSSYTIPQTTTPIDLQGTMINLTVSGLGRLIDANTLQLDLLVGISIDLFPFPLPPQACTVVLTK